MTPLDRLKAAIDILKKNMEGLTNQLIGKRIRYDSPNYVSDILGGSKPISKLFLKKMKVEYSINTEWILTGKGEMFVQDTRHDSQVMETPALYGKRQGQVSWVGVPIFDVPVVAIFNHKSSPIGYVTIPRFQDCVFGIQASGDDMLPDISNGDYILCKETSINEIINGGSYLIVTHQGNEIVRTVRVHKTNSEYISLIPANQSKPSARLARSVIHRIYKIKGVIKSY